MPPNDVFEALGHWSGYVASKQALLKAGVIRSFKQPEADFAEWLVASLLGGSLPQSRSHASFDVLAPDKRVQVKSVCKAAGNPNGYIVSAKDQSNNAAAGASHYAFVFFNDLLLDAVFIVPESVVRQWPRTQERRADIENHAEVVRLWPLVPNSVAS